MVLVGEDFFVIRYWFFVVLFEGVFENVFVNVVFNCVYGVFE